MIGYNAFLLLETYTAYQGSYRRSEMMHTIKLVGDMEMESLTCFAPIWNTTEWANKTFDLNIYRMTWPNFEHDSLVSDDGT